MNGSRMDEWLLQPVESKSIINDAMEEDGINGGRMKPLASLNVNQELPASQQGRKLRIKLSPPTENSASTMVRVAMVFPLSSKIYNVEDSNCFPRASCMF
jgi:hypothetical protein